MKHTVVWNLHACAQQFFKANDGGTLCIQLVYMHYIITSKAMMKTQCVARGGALQIFHDMYVAVEQLTVNTTPWHISNLSCLDVVCLF